MIRRVAVFVGVAVVLVGLGVGGFLYWLLAGDGVRVSLERQATAWLGTPVHIGVARARLFPQPGLHLERVEVGAPVSLTLGTVELTSDGKALLSRRIENASVVVANTRLAMPLPFSVPTNTAGTTATSSEPLHLISVRSISLRDVVITSRGRSLTISAESALDRSRLVLRSFAARAGGTALTAEGEISLAPRVDARLKVKANRLDVDELIALAGAFAPATNTSASSTSQPAARIAARISAESATAAGVTVRQFATDLEVDGTRLLLSPLTFQIFGGRYQGALTAALRDNFSGTLRSRFLDLDVGQIAAFAGTPGTVTGTLTSAGTFSGAGPDVAGAVRSASGTGTLSITSGSIRHLNLVRTVVVFFGRPAPDTTPASDRFDRLDASMSLAHQVLTFNALSLHSDDADMVGRAVLALESKALDGQVDISLSEALTAQAGRDLARYTREGNRIVLPATVGGTLDAPRISIDAAAAVQRGLKNELRRRLGNLLEQLGGSTATPP